MNRTSIFATAACLALAGCAVQKPPTGAAAIAPQAARQIPNSWAGPHRSGDVVPNWVRTFDDPELTALVEDAVSRNPDLAAPAARVEASRAAVRVAAASLYPQIALKGLGERQGREIHGSL